VRNVFTAYGAETLPAAEQLSSSDC